MFRATDVFLSYKAEDRKRVEPLLQALEADGLSVWWDQHIETGDDWREKIERQLDAAKCVVVAWSKHTEGPGGRFVRDEATRAQQRHVYVPVTIDDVRLPLGFGESQVTSLRGWRGNRADARYQTLLSAVRRVAGGGSQDEGPPVARTPVSRRAVAAGGAVAAVAAASVGGWALFQRGSVAKRNTIAVLPFENLSGDPAKTYFAEGIAGEIRNTLIRINGFKVAGSTSSEAVRHDDAQTAAKKLGVSNILTGNIRQTPSTIRVTAELIDGDTGLDRWSQSYDRSPGDVIRIQTDIAQNVAHALAVAMSASATAALAVGETTNVAAQQLAFQARDISYQYTQAAFERSLQLLDQAIALDPKYARAYAVKSFVANHLADAAPTPAGLAAGRSKALRYAQNALSIAPHLPIARSALAFVYELNLQLSEALRENSTALALASGDPDVTRNYGDIRSAVFGRRGDALRYVDEALGLDPLNPASHRAHVNALFYSRRFAEAVNYTIKLKREAPELFTFPEELGRSLLMLGQTKEAAIAFGQMDESVSRIFCEALLAARAANRDVALAKLGELQQRRLEMASYEYGVIYAELGDKDRAFAALNRAWEIRLSGLERLKTDPFLDSIRDDARYAELVGRIGFPA